MSFYSFGHRDSDDDDIFNDDVEIHNSESLRSDSAKEIMAMEDDGFYMEGESVYFTRTKPGAKIPNKGRSKKHGQS